MRISEETLPRRGNEMVVCINPASDIPIYVQLRNQIIYGIGSGQLRLGQSLPTVRQMAEDTGINVMTVNKAYNLLKQEGYLLIDGRRGAKVNPNITLDDEFVNKLKEELKLLVTESMIKGMKKETFFELCNQVYNEYNRMESEVYRI